TGNGVTLADPTLSAATAFQDFAINLGALGATGALAVQVSLTVNTDQAGAGFYGDFILGGPQPAAGVVPPDHGALDNNWRDVLSDQHGWMTHAF
ncbi:MAG TPA: hypothetical protein VKH13_15075, partial [Steroidobacteraceae bacterium]|nr:hypothetical protein [Steroidobacteraceae bacterium]